MTKNTLKTNIIDFPVFFFIYNFDNYYHFLYDTLPYLYTYLELKKNIPKLKILINYPNKNMKKLYRFNIELLEKILDLKNIIYHNDNNIYKECYVSSSLTHGGYSNNPPRKEVYIIIDIIKNNIDNEINQAKLNYMSSVATVQFQKKNMQLAESVYGQTKKKFEAGTGSNTEISAAQTDLVSAQNNFMNALYAALIAKVDLLKATGKL